MVRTALLGDRRAARIGYATVPLARFAERAAARCDEVRLRTAVTGLGTEGGRLRALHVGESEIEVDAAVLAVPPERLQRIAGAEALGVRGLDRFGTQPIVDVHLWYDRSVGGLDFAAMIGSPVQWIFVKGPGYLCCSLSSAGDLISVPRSGWSPSPTPSCGPDCPSSRGPPCCAASPSATLRRPSCPPPG